MTDNYILRFIKYKVEISLSTLFFKILDYFCQIRASFLSIEKQVSIDIEMIYKKALYDVSWRLKYTI